jgi:RimJ/RimL family protein N-acetyltransferase
MMTRCTYERVGPPTRRRRAPCSSGPTRIGTAVHPGRWTWPRWNDGSPILTPWYWGRGFGTAILGELTDRLAGRGYRSLTLSVVAANTRARRLYERAGWRARGRPEPHPRIPELQMQWYERDLDTAGTA